MSRRQGIANWTLAFLLLVAACWNAAWPATAGEGVLAGKVTRVIDGDTVDVLLSSGRIRVRLHGIDAPEGDQPGGAEATQWLRQRLLDREVLLQPVSQDRYERMVAIVRAGESVINDDLVRAGHAWAYRHYLRKADRHLCEKEFSARRQSLGLWAAPPARAPWEYRSTRGRGPFTDYARQSADDCRRAS